MQLIYKFISKRPSLLYGEWRHLKNTLGFAGYLADGDKGSFYDESGEVVATLMTDEVVPGLFESRVYNLEGVIK